jgi:hypothetical protein
VCYHSQMSSEIDSLQQRVDAIRATGDAELAARTYLALGRELRVFAKTTLKRKRFPINRRINQTDAEWLLSDLWDKAAHPNGSSPLRTCPAPPRSTTRCHAVGDA